MKIKKIQFISILAGIFGFSIFLGYTINPSSLGSYRFNPFTNNLDLVGDTTTSTGSGVTTTLNSTEVAFGASDNTVTSSANFTFNSSINQLSVTNVTTTNVTSTNLSVTGVFNFLGTTITNVATWFSGLFDSNLATKTTTNLTEGSNLYYTEARVQSELLDGNNAVFSNATTTNLALSGFTNGSVIFATSSGRLTQDNTNFYWDDVNNRLGIGTATPAKALQVAGAVNAITSVVRGTNVEFQGQDSANSAFYPRAFFYGYSGSAMVNFGFYAASGNATGTTQTPAFSGISTNAVPTQASAIQSINYIDTTKYAIYTTQAESTQRVVPIYIGHFSQPDITVATNTYIGLGNLTNPTARLSLSASTLASGGIAFGTDTNLYRVAADKLKTDDTFIASAIGVGTDSPSNPIHVSVSQNSNTSIRVTNGTSGSAAQADFRAYNSGGEFFSLGIYSAGTTAYGALTARSGFNYSSGAGGLVLMADNAAGTIRFASGGNAERMRIDTSGRLGIGTTNPTAILSLNTSTAASGGIAFGSDTNLYRSAANVLSTDDAFVVGGSLDVTGASTLAGLTFTNATGTLLSVTERTFDGTPNTDHSAVGEVTMTFNAGTTTVAMDLLYMASDGEWGLADASASTTASGMLAIGLTSGTNGNALNVALPGSFVRDDSWNWTPGNRIFLSETTAGYTTSTPSTTNSVIRVIGYAVTADVIYFNPDNTLIENL